MSPVQESATIVTDEIQKVGFLGAGVVLVLCLLALVVKTCLWMIQGGGTPLLAKPKSRYVLKKTVLNLEEKSFLATLDSIMPPDIRVLAKVRVSDILAVETSYNRTAWQAGFNKIAGRHVDFLLCRSDDLSPLAAIKLDDKTRERQASHEREDFLTEIFAQAGLPLLRIKVQKDYSLVEITERLNQAMNSVAESERDRPSQPT